MLKLAKYLKKYRVHMILGPAFKVIEAIFELIVPLVMADIIDKGIATKDTSYILSKGGLILLLGFIGLSCTLVCQRLSSYASQGFGTDLRTALFRHITSLSHAESDSFGASSLITRMTGDINQLQVAVAMMIRLVIRAPFLVIGAIIMAMMLDWKLSLIFLAIAPLVSLALFIIMKKSLPFYKSIQKKLDRLSLITSENLAGARVIRAFSENEREEARFEAANIDFNKTAESAAKISALLNPVTSIILNFGMIAVLIFGGVRVYDGVLTQGQIIAFVNYMTQILLALIVVANLVLIFTRAAASAARINEVLETMPSIQNTHEEEQSVEQNHSPHKKIVFEAVNFSYHGESKKNVLQNISFSIEAGTTFGIIGGTGSGKSTLVSLIPRFYEPTSGRILIDGKNIKTFPITELRQKIGFVPQRTALFSGTVAENIRMGKPDATDAEVISALQTAQGYDFISKKAQGINFYLEEGAKNSSGGQKQRITIARALVRNPEILILDDSSSALDYTTDAALRKELKNREKKMTVILIAQRVNAIKDCDCILVLDNGTISGLGTHHTLFSNCSVYREICTSQGELADE